MVFPANWQLATTRSASRALHILFCALFGATLILLLMVLKFGVLGRPALIFWKSPSPDTKFFLVVSAPYIVSMFLLLIPNFYTRALAFGMACVTAAVFTYWEGLFLALLLIAMVFESSPSMRSAGPPPGPIALVVFFSLLCHFIVLVSSLVLCVRGLRGVPVFLLGVILAGAYGHTVYTAQQSSQANYFKAIEDVDKESTTAFNSVESISWCSIEFASLHPAEGYPASLNLITDSPVCRRSWSLSAIPHYSVTYTSSSDTSGKVTAFSVKAVAPLNPLRAPRNAQSDQSGVALIQYQDTHDNRYPTEVGTVSPLYTIWLNKICFRDYATNHQQVGFPRKFADVPSCHDAFRQYGSSFVSDTVIKYGAYLFTYLPSTPDRAGKIDSYQLQATCQAYGTSCLHSFMLTNTGQVFVTSANRPATPQDTLLPLCPRRPPTTTFCIQGE
jgi:hypothetical protein